MAKSEVVCTAAHAVDLDDGSTLLPGQEGKADLSHPHNQALQRSGALTEGPSKKKAADHETKEQEAKQ